MAAALTAEHGEGLAAQATERHSKLEAASCGLQKAGCRRGCIPSSPGWIAPGAFISATNGSKHKIDPKYMLPRTCLSENQAPRKQVTVAYLLRGFVFENDRRPAGLHRPRHFTLDVRNYWDAHRRSLGAMRAASVDIYFITYVIHDEAANVTLGEWMSARARSVIIMPHSNNSSASRTAAEGLRNIPRYDYYVLTRVDITFKPAFMELLGALPLNFSELVALNQETGGYVNDIWFCFPHSLRGQVETFLKHSIASRHAHWVHIWDTSSLPVALLSVDRYQGVAARNRYYALGGQELTRATASRRWLAEKEAWLRWHVCRSVSWIACPSLLSRAHARA